MPKLKKCTTNTTPDSNKWISVKDRLPPDFVSVILLYKDRFGEEVLTGHWDSLNKSFVQTAVGFFWLGKHNELHHKKKDVTHWMPLPEPPK